MGDQYDKPELNSLDVSFISAAARGNLPRVRELLALNANVNAVTDGHRKTALHEAARFGHTHIVEMLLSHGANPNAENYFYRTPLHEAAEHAPHAATKAIVQFLLAHGALADVMDVERRTAERMARAANKLEVADLLRHAARSRPRSRE